jgi:hypothetical protein
VGEVIISGAVLPTFGSQNYGALELGVGYGRIREGFWMSYQAGGTAAMDASWPPARILLWSASLRAGYETWALRIVGVITSQEAVFEKTYYVATLEKLWSY